MRAAARCDTVVFYGAAAYNAAPAAFDASVFINTPITVDAQGNVFFGFMVTAANPAGLVSGIARVDANGVGIWTSAAARGRRSGDRQGRDEQRAGAVGRREDAVRRGQHRPRRRPDPGGLSRSRSTARRSPLKSKALLVDPALGTPARVSDDSTASPTVGPDGDVYFGVLETTFGTHNGRGWLLHFDATLATQPRPRQLRLGRHRVGRSGVDGAVVSGQLELPADDQVQQLRRHRQRRRREPAGAARPAGEPDRPDLGPRRS